MPKRLPRARTAVESVKDAELWQRLSNGGIFSDGRHRNFAKAIGRTPSPALKAAIELAALHFLNTVERRRHIVPSLLESELRQIEATCSKLMRQLQDLPHWGKRKIEIASLRKTLRSVKRLGVLKRRKIGYQYDLATALRTWRDGRSIPLEDMLHNMADPFRVDALRRSARWARIWASREVGTKLPGNPRWYIVLELSRASGLPLRTGWDDDQQDARGPLVELVFQVLHAIENLNLPELNLPAKRANRTTRIAAKRLIERVRQSGLTI